MNTNILMLVRREIWEHRSLWIVPLALAGVILVIAAFGGVHFGDGNNNFSFGSRDHLENLSPSEREHLLAKMNPGEGTRQMVFFYLLDALLAERRDRSILFWKSMPISDGQVVASKALTALAVAPAFVFVVSAVLLLVFAGVVSLRLGELPFNPWSASVWLQVQAVMLGFIPMVVLWYLPLAGYLMVVSVWVRKNAFLWAVLPPIGLLLIEGMITHTDYVAEFLGERFAGFIEVMNPGTLRHLDNVENSDLALSASYKLMGQVFADPEIWIGTAAGLALIYLAVRIRRFRDDS
jgi:ABC-2 type transport system permease protein